jgi:putative ABC transport system substrate-binding protein
VTLQPLAIRSPADLDGAVEAAVRGRADALFVSQDALFATHRARIAELAAKNRLPAMFEIAGDEGLIAYAANPRESYRRAASYVDRILKGARPGDLPVEQPTTFELTVNLKIARALGLTLPRPRVLRADRVIQ